MRLDTTRMPRRLGRVALVTLCLVSFPLDAHAGDTHGRTDVQLTMLGSPWFDAGYIVLGAGALLVGSLVDPPDVEIAPFDGLGQRPERPVFGTANDVVLGAGSAVSIGLAALIERLGSDSRDWMILRAPLVLGESLLMTIGVVALLKDLVGECRPRAWDDATRSCVGRVRGMPVRNDRTSFPSGHAASMGALAGASFGLWLFPSRARTEHPPLVLTTGALAIANMLLRVLAGAHSWVDTSVGLALGFGTGLVTAGLHTSSERSTARAFTVSPHGIAYGGRL